MADVITQDEGFSLQPGATIENIAIDDGNGTIGSRLRKRRRTDSTLAGAPASKRPSTTTRGPRASRHSQLTTTSHERPASLLPFTNGSHSKSPSLTPLPSSSISQAPSESSRVSSPIDQVSRASQTQALEELPQSQFERSLIPITQPDLAAVIANIIDHGEHVDSLRGYNETGYVDTESAPTLGASLHLKMESLPILDNLATQILNSLAKSTYSEIVTMITDPESESGSTYATLKSLFDHTKKVYAISDPFINPYELGPSEYANIDIIRKANMATFVSSVFGSREVGFYHLNEYFLDTFVADGSRLLKQQAQLFLDLKTQAYISAMSNGERSREEILEDLFPVNLEDRLLSRRPGAEKLAPSEGDFLQRARNRSKALLEEAGTEEAIAMLPEKYNWEDFLREVTGYVSKNFELIVGVPSGRKITRMRPSNGASIDQPLEESMLRENNHSQDPSPPEPQQNQHHLARQIQHYQQQQALLYARQQQNHSQAPMQNHNSNQSQIGTDDIAEKAARAAQYAMQGFGMSHEQHVQQHSQQPLQPQNLQHQHQHQQQRLQPQAQPQFAPEVQFQLEHDQSHPQQQLHPSFYHAQMLHPEMAQHQAMYGDSAAIHPTQTAPTQVLYERARMAATAKASPTNRRAGTPSARRPWTTEEENALMAGLDRVKGPHWSQILAMFGPGGTINESLKDRNQVQLKDKARNLKLFFLKSGIEVPYYLQFVTGELKTRAPAQAAKNEAKAREQSEGGSTEAIIARAHQRLQDGTPDDTESGTPAFNGEEDVETDLVIVGEEADSEDQKPFSTLPLATLEADRDAIAPILESVEFQPEAQVIFENGEDVEDTALDAEAARAAALVSELAQAAAAAAMA